MGPQEAVKLRLLIQDRGVWEGAGLYVQPACRETHCLNRLARANLGNGLLFILGSKAPFKLVLTMCMYYL